MNRTHLALPCALALTVLACPSEKKAPEPTAAKPSAALPTEHTTPMALGPLKLDVPDGFDMVERGESTLTLRHISDLTVSIGVVPSINVSSDEKTVTAFLSAAEVELRKLPEAKVNHESRTLPNSSVVIKGVVAHTVDRRGSPVNERREMWVARQGPIVVTASFIYIEDAASAVNAVEAILRMLREALEAAVADVKVQVQTERAP